MILLYLQASRSWDHLPVNFVIKTEKNIGGLMKGQLSWPLPTFRCVINEVCCQLRRLLSSLSALRATGRRHRLPEGHWHCMCHHTTVSAFMPSHKSPATCSYLYSQTRLIPWLMRTGVTRYQPSGTAGSRGTPRVRRQRLTQCLFLKARNGVVHHFVWVEAGSKDKTTAKY